MNFRVVFFAVFSALFCLCAGCSRTRPAPLSAPEAVPPETVPLVETPPPGPAYPALDKLFAIVKPGDDPIWFELGAEGPVHIPSPEAAGSVPHQPWTAARFITGMNLGSGRLVMAVNRYGFLVWAFQNGEAALYQLSEPAWDGLTVAALFRYAPGDGDAGNDSGPWDAALLYRDDVFSGAGGGPPGDRVRALPPGGFEVETLDIPAFSPLSGSEGWDLESLRQGRDGTWYFRGVRRGTNPASVYYRASKLTFPGDSVAFGVFRNAVSPYNYIEAPPVLREALEEAAALEGGKTLIAAVVSPVFDAPHYFATGGSEDMSSFTDLSGFYLPRSSSAEFPGNEGASAALLFPDGTLVYAAEDEGVSRAALPGLPEGFVYTRLGAAGDVLIAAWEEQLEWNIGASGFMVIKTGRLEPPGGRK
jgi:hypothetical protein